MNGIRRTALAVFLILATLSVAVAADKGPVEQRIKRFLDDTRTPGVSIAVIDHTGQSPKLYCDGYADVALKVPMKKDMVFPIGSITKLFTTLAIRMLADDHIISLDDKISTWFPGYPNLDGITVSELVNHTSGVKDFVQTPAFSENPAKPYSEEDILKMAATLPLDFPHGTRYAYSNTGYVMLGIIVENVSNQSFDQFIGKRISEPLGMTDTRTYNDKDIISNRVTGYAVESGQLQNAMPSSIQTPHAAGNLVSSPKSFIKLSRIFRSGILLKPSTRQMICTPPSDVEAARDSQCLDYKGKKLTRVCKCGIEWVRIGDGPWFLTKNGVFPGYSSIFIYSPEHGTSAALCSNNENAIYDLAFLGIDLLDTMHE